MSARSNNLQVKKVVKSIVDQIVSESEGDGELQADEPMASLKPLKNERAENVSEADESDVRRSVRARKEPDRLDTNKMLAAKQTRKRAAPFKFELEVSPPPADLKGILKKVLKPFPPPRKSSLSATAGKNIAKKYRKVRVSRVLKIKVIPPLPGWREDRRRLPDSEPDEEELQRLEKLEEDEKKKEQKKRRKRKSLGVPTVPSVSEDDMNQSDEVSGPPLPASPDVFYDEYIKANSPDSVLASDGEAEAICRPAARTLFSTINETTGEDMVADKDTVAATPEKKERQRSVRIQPPDEQPKAAEKKEKRKSRLFPVTPVKEVDAPVVDEEEEGKPVEKKSARRKSLMLLRPATATTVAEDESTTKSSSSSSRRKADYPLNPYNDDPCRSEEERAAARVHNMKHKSIKVANWLARPDTPAAAEDLHSDEIETSRGSESRESQLSLPHSDSNGSKRLVEEKTEQAKRKGRRSRKFEPQDIPSNSSKSSFGEEKEKETEKKPQAHPFFAKFDPKRSASVLRPVPAPPPAVADKKHRRRSTFMPKKPAAAKRDGSPVEAEKKKEESEGEAESIEIVAEVKRKEKKNGVTFSSPLASCGHPSIWRSTEIDAAPYAGLVHVGREEEEEMEMEDAELVKEVRRMSIQQPEIRSYAIPSSVRDEESASAELMAVFDDSRSDGRAHLPTESTRAAALAVRARDLADECTPVAWPEAMRPRRVSECIGDPEVLTSGQRWLHKWKKRLDAACAEEEKAAKAPKAKRKKRRGGGYSDESEQEDSDPDFELRDDECRLPNPLVLSGPIGCGKSAYLRALSSECGFSLLESGPDERRAGAQLRAKLAGAVANYRMSSKPAGGIAAFFSPKNGGAEKKVEEKKEEERGKGRQHTLVVIEHVDVVFAEEDKLFWPALAEILATTKIPIALTCNIVPDELARVLAQAEEAGAAEHLEMTMERAGGVEEYVEASLNGTLGRAIAATVIPAIVARARTDLRAALHDAHWAAAADLINKVELMDARARRVDAPTMCDRVTAQTFAWRDACARTAEAIGSSEVTRAAQWPARRGMPADVYARLSKEIDQINLDVSRAAEERATRMMEMARSGLSAGNKGRTGMLTRREVAEDWMPVLEQIDRREQAKRKEYGRRHQHYFNVIKDMETGLSIDPLDRIQGACAFFRLPQ